ncbi:RtcB family protein [archaeon]|nr:RtcB family protein [archaeon]
MHIFIMHSSFIFKKGFFITTKNNKEIKIPINKVLFKKISKDAFEQLFSISNISQVSSPILAMPDIHPGFGVPIGTVFASLKENAIISSEAVGYDINCGIRVVKTNLFLKDFTKEQLKDLASSLKKLPLGLSNNGLKITEKDYKQILTEGINWAVSKKYCLKKDLNYIYNNGFFKDASPSFISKDALKRGKSQLGTLGQGNHFIDILVVDKVFNKIIGEQFSLKKGQLVIMIHSGSRGLGHQIASDYFKKFKFKNPLSHATLDSKEGSSYYKAMLAAANFAFVNRAVLTYFVNLKFNNFFNKKIKFDLLYDLSHNLASLEKHNDKEYLVTRKGSTRVFLPEDLSSKSPFKKTGSPIILPGSMLDDTYLLIPDKGVKNTFCSVAHGSGRSLSRKEAKEKISFKDLKLFMEKNNVILENVSENLAREEQPSAYKSSNEVVKSMVDSKMVKKVLTLKPVIVLIG